MLQGRAAKQTGHNSPTRPRDILIALGGNLTSAVGAPAETLRAALVMLENTGAVIRATSKFYHTPAFPLGNGPDYVNAAVRVEAVWSPEGALAQLHRIEAELGRERQRRWGQRTLDLDLLAVGEVILPDRESHRYWRALPLKEQMAAPPGNLVLPHPRLQERAFVLVPLADVAPDWRHPILGRTVAEMLADLGEDERMAVRVME